MSYPQTLLHQRTEHRQTVYSVEGEKRAFRILFNPCPCISCVNLLFIITGDIFSTGLR